MKIEELRGVSRIHLASRGGNYDIFLEVCHQADKKKNPDAFAIVGQRYVVVNTETGSEVPCYFPNHVEDYLALAEKAESGEAMMCENCGVVIDGQDTMYQYQQKYFCGKDCGEEHAKKEQEDEDDSYDPSEYKCPDCGATAVNDDSLEEYSVGDGYVCPNCGYEGMEAL